MDRDTRKILLRVPNWIGDAVMCLPAVDSLRTGFPKARITVLAKSVVVPVFEHNPSVDDILVYDRGGRHGGITGRIRLSGEIRNQGYDLAVLFQNAFDAAFISFISGIPERAGYARDMRRALLTKPVPVTDEVRRAHHTRYYLNISSALGCPEPMEPTPRLYVSEEEAARARDLIRENGLEGRPLAGAAPGASYGPAKMWPAENFAEALTGLYKRYGTTALIFGGPDDAEAAGKVSEGLSIPHLNLAGKINLREFMAIASGLDVFITNDSGPMHISYALGVPTVAVFGSTDPVATGPLGKLSRVVRKDIECSPCFDRECRYGHYRCLKDVAVEDVLRAATGLMDKGAEHA